MLVSDVHCIVKNPLGKSWEANSAKPIENDSTTASIVMSCLIDIFFGRGIIRLIQSKKRWIIWNTQQFCHLQKYFIICLALFENSLAYYAIINSKKNSPSSYKNLIGVGVFAEPILNVALKSSSCFPLDQFSFS